MEGLGGASLKRVRKILEGYLEAFDKPPIERDECDPDETPIDCPKGAGDIWEAKAKGYDPNNLPLCGLCGEAPKAIASAPDMGEVMIDHKCKMPEFHFTGPGHLWFLTEHKGDRK